eukprot:gnl/TRDRNA2_/TRDRNA2_36598_c0_seq1.p1 gnl/TRDRNA2_/TRDRNA2_36598_c0~~gnl/TRDRNA2_/TRDRNA2_36598_c0_seq1.p1  ORF type:complete len:482 (-),score=165.61 gnl/TRDRNA2_/TRDRNA2_36598_c0_seq1:73-1518(-)
MSVDYQNGLLWRGADPSKKVFKPQHDQGAGKVTRYFPGQVPAWVKKQEEEEKKAQQERKKKDEDLCRKRRAPTQEDAAVNRLKRLQETNRSGDAASERLLRHRVMHDARVLEASQEKKAEEFKEDIEAKLENLKSDLLEPKKEDKSSSKPLGLLVGDVSLPDQDIEDDEELRNLRRERAREMALLKRKEEEVLLKEEEEDLDVPEEEDDEESEYETDSEDDPQSKAMMKPVFVSKAARDTIKEREALKKEEEEAEEKRKVVEAQKKVESKQMLIEKIKEDDLAEQQAASKDENDASDIELIDDNDEVNEAEEYELWKIRELKRIKRDKEEKNIREGELAEILRRRNMTDEERAEDDKRLDALENKRDDVKQFNFMQKYYHRGGFFQDKAVSGEEPLYLRDYHEPLAEERYDKSLLPKVMQVRRGLWGKKGQVKHTHLTDSDTTDMQAPWAQHTKQVEKYQQKMAGASGVNSFSRPSSSKKP